MEANNCFLRAAQKVVRRPFKDGKEQNQFQHEGTTSGDVETPFASNIDKGNNNNNNINDWVSNKLNYIKDKFSSFINTSQSEHSGAERAQRFAILLKIWHQLQQKSASTNKVHPAASDEPKRQGSEIILVKEAGNTKDDALHQELELPAQAKIWSPLSINNNFDEGYGPSTSRMEIEDIEELDFNELDDSSLYDLDINCATPTSIDSGRPLKYCAPPLETNEESKEKMGTYTIIQRANSTCSSICSTPSTILQSAFSRLDEDSGEILAETLRSKIDRINEELALLYKDTDAEDDFAQNIEEKDLVEEFITEQIGVEREVC